MLYRRFREAANAKLTGTGPGSSRQKKQSGSRDLRGAPGWARGEKEMHNFDKRFENFDRSFKRTRRFAFVAVIFNALLGLGLLGLVIWVAAHFLKRYW